ncbi:MAG: hypothetical protein ABR551_00110 [Gemmatimonadales bacterium]
MRVPTPHSSFAVLALAGLLTACGDSAPPEDVALAGECGDAFGGQICTWGTADAAGTILAYGVTVPMTVIEGAPADHEMAFPPVANAIVRMPAEVTAATGVDHFTFFWEPHGHPPGAYLTPHFDFHFYGISGAAREAIDCADPMKPETLAAGYALPDLEIPELGTLVGMCVPAMGMHSAPGDQLASDVLFDGTMIIGYYQQRPIFFEPMIAQQYLLRRESFDLAMPSVPGVPSGVRYPGQFRAEYDAASDSYRFTFTGS